MGSSRLPGKSLLPLDSTSLLEFLLGRIRRAQSLDLVMVVTSDRTLDDPIVAVCTDLNVPCYRGSETDVLDRFFRAAKQAEAWHSVRVTGDCPLLEPALIDRVVSMHVHQGNDLTASDVTASYPRGMDVEAVSFEALEAAWSEATAEADREHVTPFIYAHPDRFQIRFVVAPSEHHHPDLRLCVDEEADLALIRKICGHFAPRNDFSLTEMIAFLDRYPEVAALNRHVVQKPAS